MARFARVGILNSSPAVNWDSIVPRDGSLSDSGCIIFSDWMQDAYQPEKLSKFWNIPWKNIFLLCDMNTINYIERFLCVVWKFISNIFLEIFFNLYSKHYQKYIFYCCVTFFYTNSNFAFLNYWDDVISYRKFSYWITFAYLTCIRYA